METRTVTITECGGGRRHVAVEGEGFVDLREVTTSYPPEIIHSIADALGPAWVCNEISRTEDPSPDLELLLTAFTDPAQMFGKRLLDFGCGQGASTVQIARLMPDTEIVGVELEAKLLRVAQMRAAHHKIHATFYLSPAPDQIPDVGVFDAIVMSAVYEHLLPSERGPLMRAVWDRLVPGGVLYIDELPHRWFPVEWHTTRLPLLNYLPRRVAERMLPRSDRFIEGQTWEWWLRRGVRGATSGEVRKHLPGAQPLRPSRLGMTTHADLWFATAHYIGNERARRVLRRAFRALDRVALLEPSLALAFRKPTHDP